VRQNTGHMPADAKGKRIRGVLANGMRFGFGSLAEEGAPAGWPADDCDWKLRNHPFAIAEFEVI
jgi:hypothetical protein